MNRRMAFLLGGTAAMMSFSAAQAAVPALTTVPTSAAHSYADLLEPVPNAVAALNAADLSRAQTPKSQLRLAQDHHHHHHHHHHSAYFYPQPYYAPRYYAPPAYSSGVAWCIQHYRSYDPRTETYLGYDGYRHRCP